MFVYFKRIEFFIKYISIKFLVLVHVYFHANGNNNTKCINLLYAHLRQMQIWSGADPESGYIFRIRI